MIFQSGSQKHKKFRDVDRSDAEEYISIENSVGSLDCHNDALIIALHLQNLGRFLEYFPKNAIDDIIISG